MKKILLSCMLVFAFVSTGGAELAEIGLNPFQLDIGSRPLGMGGTFVGLADDVNAALYNPGGLAWAKGIELTVKDADNLSAIQAYPTGTGASLGFALINSKVSGLNTSSGLATSSSNIIALSYGTKLNLLPFFNRNENWQKFGVGINVKLLYKQSLRITGSRDRSGTGGDIDLGILWKGGEWWSAGLSLQNILPTRLTWDSSGAEGFPAIGKIGLSGKVIGDLFSPVFMDGRELNLNGELAFGVARPTLLRIGGEWGINKKYYVRTGVMQQWRGTGLLTSLNLGLGFRSASWGVDLANYHEPLKDETQTCITIMYFPPGWLVNKKLETIKPSIMLESALEKISIEDNIVTYNDKIDISGRVKLGVEVYIDGQRAAVSDDQTFKVVVPLKIGKNLILVEARYQGEKKIWKYKVLRKVKMESAEEKVLGRALAEAKTAEEKTKLKAAQKEAIDKRKKAEDLATAGIIEAKPTVKLNDSISRGKLATWLAKASGLPVPKVTKDPLPDVKKEDPMAPYIKLAVDKKLLLPFSDGTFRATAPVSKPEGERLKEMIKEAAETGRLPEKGNVPPQEAVKPIIEEIYLSEVIEVSSEAKFNLQTNISRNEVITWIVNNLKKPPLIVKEDVCADIKKDDPLAPYINYVLKKNFLPLFPDGTFRLNAPVPPAEAEKIFASVKREAK
ncbi:MAG: S-layer homology domain-containing protein [bacterium]